MQPADSAENDSLIAHWTVDRRELFGLIGAATLLTACGSPGHDPVTVSSSGPTPPGPSQASATPGPSPARSSTSAVAHIGGAKMPVRGAIDVADAKRLAPLVNGHWRGTWHDDTGRNGTADATVALNAGRRIATATLAVAGDLLGSPVATQSYEVDLLAFVLRANQWQVTTPQFGRVTIVPGGVRSVTATATAIGGHPEIASVQVIGSRIGSRVDVTYTIKQTTGATVKGTMSFSAKGDRPAAPPLTKAGDAPSPGDVQSGAYAASLLTGAQLTQLTGTSLPDPHPNGGRIEYTTGIDVSNAQSIKHGLDIDYSVYVGHTAALTSAFWRTSRDSLVGAPTVAGPWLDARWYASGPTLYVHATRTRTLTVRVLNLNGNANQTAAEHQAASIARRLAAVLKTGS